MCTKKMQNFFRVKRAKGVVIKVCDVLVFVSWLVKPCFAYSWPEVLVCHFEMFAVGVRCALFPSTREANFSFKKRNGDHVWEGHLVDTHFCQWLVSVPCILSLQVIFQSKIPAKSYVPRALAEPGLCRFVSNWQPYGLSNWVKIRLEASLRTIQVPQVCTSSCYVNESLAFLRQWRFFVKNCLVLVNAHSCLIAHCEFTTRLLFCLHTWVCPLLNSYLFYSRDCHKTLGDQKDSTREYEDKVKNIILEFG